MEYQTEIFDRMQWLYEATGFNDHQVHCEMGLASAPDEATLRRAVELSLAAHPILATKYALRGECSSWVALQSADLGRSFLATREEAVFAAERTYRIREEEGPQVRFCLLAGKRNALAVTINHMIADGSGFKDYLYSVCETYTRLGANPGYVRLRPLRATAAWATHRMFGPAAKAAAFLGSGGASNRAGSFAFPLDDGGTLKPIIATRTIGREKVARLKERCSSHEATVNDAALAAYYRVLARRFGPSALTRLEIPIMIDMRRYLGSGRSGPLRNLASTAITRVRERRGELRGHAAEDEGEHGRAQGAHYRPRRDREALRAFLAAGRGRSVQAARAGPQESPHLHDEHRRARLEETGLGRRARRIGLRLRLHQAQAAFPARDLRLRRRASPSSSNLYGSEKDEATLRALLGEVEEKLT